MASEADLTCQAATTHESARFHTKIQRPSLTEDVKFSINLSKNRNLQQVNCDYGCDVIIASLAQNENRNLLIYFKKSQKS